MSQHVQDVLEIIRALVFMCVCEFGTQVSDPVNETTFKSVMKVSKSV